MAVPRFCWRLRIGGSVDRSGEGGGEGVEQIAQQGSRPASIHPRQDHVRTRQEDLGTPANYAWEYGSTPLLTRPPAAIYSWGSHWPPASAGNPASSPTTPGRPRQLTLAIAHEAQLFGVSPAIYRW